MLCPQTPSIKTQSLLLLLLYFTAFIYTASNIRKEIVQILKLDLPERRFKERISRKKYAQRYTVGIEITLERGRLTIFETGKNYSIELEV